jgi:biotin carboxylase
VDERERVLVIASTRAYQTDDLVAAADALGVELRLATDRCHVLAERWPEGALPIDLRDPERAAAAIASAEPALSGIVATDEVTAHVAALAAARLGLPFNPPATTAAAFDKLAMRRALSAAGCRQPAFAEVAVDADPEPAARAIGFPVVIKPRHLSTSRGVMRADDPRELAERWRRLGALVARPELEARHPEAAGSLIVEAYIDGCEVAYEGLVRGGEVQRLAIFDKPDAPSGPTFEETIYLTPSRLAAADQAAIERAVNAAARAIGLVEGPVHAELRLAADGAVVIELAARAIGGLCGRALRFGAGWSLAEVLIAHAAGRAIEPRREHGASGVLMLPVSRAGVLRGVRGVAAAEAIAGVREVAITVRPGEHLEPLPEGSHYMGFVFAVADTSTAAEAALRDAWARLEFDIAETL